MDTSLQVDIQTFDMLKVLLAISVH